MSHKEESKREPVLVKFSGTNNKVTYGSSLLPKAPLKLITKKEELHVVNECNTCNLPYASFEKVHTADTLSGEVTISRCPHAHNINVFVSS